MVSSDSLVPGNPGTVFVTVLKGGCSRSLAGSSLPAGPAACVVTIKNGRPKERLCCPYERSRKRQAAIQVGGSRCIPNAAGSTKRGSTAGLLDLLPGSHNARSGTLSTSITAQTRVMDRTRNQRIQSARCGVYPSRLIFAVSRVQNSWGIMIIVRKICKNI